MSEPSPQTNFSSTRAARRCASRNAAASARKSCSVMHRSWRGCVRRRGRRTRSPTPGSARRRRARRAPRGFPRRRERAVGQAADLAHSLVPRAAPRAAAAVAHRGRGRRRSAGPGVDPGRPRSSTRWYATVAAGASGHRCSITTGASGRASARRRGRRAAASSSAATPRSGTRPPADRTGDPRVPRDGGRTIARAHASPRRRRRRYPRASPTVGERAERADPTLLDAEIDALDAPSTPSSASRSARSASSSRRAASGSGPRSATGRSSAPAATPTTRGASTPAPRSSCSTRFALVHDDVMDGSDRRRGLPVGPPRVHRPARRRRAGAARRRRFGEGAAILVGDFAFVYADMLMADGPAPTRAPVFDELRVELCVGQYLDLVGTATGGRDPGAGARASSGTSPGKYTVERPLHLGAALAGPARRARARRSAPFGLPARRGVPAARRPARRVRRRGGHRQAGRRRPARGQAHAAARRGGGPGRRRRPRAARTGRRADLDRRRDRRALQTLLVETGAVAPRSRPTIERLVDESLDRARRRRRSPTRPATRCAELGRFVAWRDR